MYSEMRRALYCVDPLTDVLINGLRAVTCMLGDSEKYNALIRIRPRNNRISEIYPILPQGLEESFGFIVE